MGARVKGNFTGKEFDPRYGHDRSSNDVKANQEFNNLYASMRDGLTDIEEIREEFRRIYAKSPNVARRGAEALLTTGTIVPGTKRGESIYYAIKAIFPDDEVGRNTKDEIERIYEEERRKLERKKPIPHRATEGNLVRTAGMAVAIVGGAMFLGASGGLFGTMTGNVIAETSRVNVGNWILGFLILLAGIGIIIWSKKSKDNKNSNRKTKKKR